MSTTAYRGILCKEQHHAHTAVLTAAAAAARQHNYTETCMAAAAVQHVVNDRVPRDFVQGAAPRTYGIESSSSSSSSSSISTRSQQQNGKITAPRHTSRAAAAVAAAVQEHYHEDMQQQQQQQLHRRGQISYGGHTHSSRFSGVTKTCVRVRRPLFWSATDSLRFVIVLTPYDDHTPSHLHNAGTEHVGFSPIRQGGI